jgi:hypothetical protein
MEDADAAFAARLQAEENGRARTTRGGTKGGSAVGSKKGSPAKQGKSKKRKSKSKAKVDSGEESDADGEPKEEKERKGGFHVGLLREGWSGLTDRNRCCSRRRWRSCWASRRYVRGAGTHPTS